MIENAPALVYRRWATAPITAARARRWAELLCLALNERDRQDQLGLRRRPTDRPLATPGQMP